MWVILFLSTDDRNSDDANCGPLWDTMCTGKLKHVKTSFVLEMHGAVVVLFLRATPTSIRSRNLRWKCSSALRRDLYIWRLTVSTKVAMKWRRHQRLIPCADSILMCSNSVTTLLTVSGYRNSLMTIMDTVHSLTEHLTQLLSTQANITPWRYIASISWEGTDTSMECCRSPWSCTWGLWSVKSLNYPRPHRNRPNILHPL